MYVLSARDGEWMGFAATVPRVYTNKYTLEGFGRISKMKMNARRCWLMAGLAIGVLGNTTLAQVAPPPTQPAKEEPKYDPPAKKVAPAQPAAKPAAQPAKTTHKQDNRIATLPTSTPYPKLLSKDENGKIVRLTELPDILALRSNPTVGQKSVTAIMPVLFGRRARFERMVIDNLDLYWMATDGRIETMSLSDIKSLTQTSEMIKPLVGRTTLTQELQSRGILTRTQAGMNEHIVNEYKQGVTSEIQFEAEDPMSEVLKFVLEDSIHETSQAYRAMVAEISIQVGDLIKETGLTSSAAMAVAELQRPLSEDRDTQIADLAELDAALRKLDVEEGITLFTAMRNTRKNPDISPAIHTIDVMHDRKVDISDSKAMQGTITYPDGRVVNTKDAAAQHNEKLKKQTEELEKEKEGKASNP
tara:strand:- start:93918 stop:95165 length:1248 start_codon:yes stop_codon:yes gene_type:complete